MLKFLVAAAACVLCVAPAHAQNPITLVDVDAYGTLNAGGVVAVVGGDSNGNASAGLEWRASGETTFHPAQPLVRVDATHFVGSLFWLTAGTAYDVRVTLSDPDGASPASTASFSTRAEASTFVPLRTLYVAPTGSDSHDGSSPAQAFATIQHASTLARAGDLVSIAAGVYREDVRVEASGTATQPIVFRGASGAILDGADAAIAAGITWTNAGNGVWSHATGFATAHVVTDQGRLFQYSSLADLRALAAGAPGGFYFDGTTLSLKFSDGSTAAQRQINVARLDEGVYIDGQSYVRIENLEIRHYGSDAYGKGVYLRYASDCSVSGNRIHENGSTGVWLKGGDRNLVERNDISDSSVFGWPWALVHGSSAEDSTISFTDAIGRGNVVRNNHLHGTYDGLHPCGSAPPTSGFSNETDVYGNTIDQHGDDAIESEGYCSNVRLWGNHISDSLMAFAVAPAGTGPLWIVRNTAYDLGNTRSALVDGQVSSGIKINSGYSTPVGPLRVFHNSFVTTMANTDAIVLMDPGDNTDLVSRNNLFMAPARALTKINTIPVDMDYDDLWSSGGATLVNWYSTNYANLAAFQGNVGEELHAISAAPSLTDPAAGDFTPLDGSALIDRGIALPGIDDGFGGTAPDIGAVERNDPIFADGFDP